MTRRVVGVLLAVATLMPIAFVAPSGGAIAGETCTHISGAAFFTPPLPVIFSKATVPFALTTQGVKLYTCTGSGGTIGNASLTVKEPVKTNCRGLSSGVARTASGAGKINWSKGKPSTLAVTFTFPRGTISPQVTGRVTSGQFQGFTVSTSLLLNPSVGNCGSTPLSKLTIQFANGANFVIAKPSSPTTTTTSSTTSPM